jgi:hypothetical protein
MTSLWQGTGLMLHQKRYGVLFVLVAVAFFGVASQWHYEPHHLGVLAEGWPQIIPAVMAPVLGLFGLLGFYSTLQSLWPDTRVSLIGLFAVLGSPGFMAMMGQPSLGLLAWVLTLVTMAVALRWWQWRSGVHAEPISPWHPWDVGMGLLLGVLGGSLGLLPLAVVGMTLAWWFMGYTRKRFSIREWWESYKGVTLIAGVLVLVGIGTKLALGAMQGASVNTVLALVSPVSTVPFSVKAMAGHWVMNVLMLGFPWYPLVVYALLNAFKHFGYKGRSGKLFCEESHGFMALIALWCLVAVLLALAGIFFQVETSFSQLWMGTAMASAFGYAMSVASRFITLSIGCQATLYSLPLFLLGLGILSAWNHLTQLPDVYLDDVIWQLPGVPALTGTQGLSLFMGLPFWKVWLFVMPAWCLVGSLMLTAMQVLRGLSLLRTVYAYAGWGFMYALLMLAVQWPVAFPVQNRSQAFEALAARHPLPVCCNTLPPYHPRGHYMPVTLTKSPQQVLVPESYFYGQSVFRSYQALYWVPERFWGISPSPWLVTSLIDVLPLYAPVPQQQHRVMARLKRDAE